MGAVSAQPVGHADEEPQVIHLGGEQAVVLPIDEYRRLLALDRLASEEDQENALAESVMERHREWVAAGRPGVKSHAQVREMLLGGSGPAE
jgi:hypothetical protein